MQRTPFALLILLLAVALVACQVPAISSTPAMTTGAVTPLATPAAATPSPAAATLAPKSTATPVAVETPTGLPTPSPLEVKRADLVLATRASGQDFEFVQKLVREFTANTGRTVEVVPKEGDVLRLDFETTVLAGQGYDLVWTVGDDVGPLVAADLLRPVADFFKAADYVPAAVTAASLNGSQWGVPLSASNHLLLFYNKKLILGPPRTTDELLSLP
ncbi:MAG: extracellular solute-binding protein, partial [Chloroflexota bacterium]|nr:extracellular solute-binding protein [Chloroflexota bacterium]